MADLTKMASEELGELFKEDFFGLREKNLCDGMQLSRFVVSFEHCAACMQASGV